MLWVELPQVTTAHNIAILVVVFVVYCFGLVVYRLFLCSLAKFPGPKIAASTFSYQFWHDVVCRGQYIWVVQSIHAKYGPIVHINPYEIHISDPSFYDTLYASGGVQRKKNKWAWDTVGAAGVADSTLSTIDHDLHRVRHSAIAPFFSSQNVRKLELVIQAKVDLLFRRLAAFKGVLGDINLSHPFSAFTNCRSYPDAYLAIALCIHGIDVIMEYSFARSFHRLEAPDFDPSYKKASHKSVLMAQIAKHLRFLTWIAKALLCLPESLAEKLGPNFRMFLFERRQLFGEIEALKRESTATGPDSAHVTVFRELLDSKLPSSEKEVQRLAADAQVLVSARERNDDVLTALKLELEAAIPSTDPAERISLAQIQHLPYLSGVIKESLRLSYGVVGRLARVWPKEDMQFREWTIPAGTAVSMTSYDVHHDESIFSHSFDFKPERWVGNPGLERYLVSFGKGTGQCLGMNLAYAEMYLTLARLFRWFGSGAVRSGGDVGMLELFETDESDIKMVAEALVPFMKKGSTGVRAVISP